VRLRGEGGYESRAHISAWKGFVQGKGADEAICKPEVINAGAECYVTVPSLGNRLELVDISNDFTFDGIEIIA
jgi:hypothetical protein